MIKFSIVIPVYQVEAYLQTCVDSLLAQSYRDFEVIIVDDGSTDQSPAICDSCKQADSRVQVIHQENAGNAVARNVGVSRAQGEYVVFIDSDDWISSSDFLQELSQHCDGGCDVVQYGYRKYFEKDGSFGTPVCDYPAGIRNQTIEDGIMALLQADMYDGAAWTKAVRRQFLLENNISFRPGMISEDVDWFLQVVVNRPKMDVVPKSYINYRQRGSSLSKSPTKKSLEDNLWILETWPSRFMQMELPTSFRSVLMSVLARYWGNLMVLYASIPQSLVSSEKKRMKDLFYLRNYALTRRAKILSACTKLVGFDATVWMLRLILKWRKK